MDKILKNQLFKVAVDYIYKEHLVESQGELADKIGISSSALSRIMNNKKFVGDDTLRKMNEVFGGIFNMAYFRGESTVLLIEDTMNFMAPENNKNEIDQSSLVNAALAAKDETIASQRETIESLKRENALLRQQLSNYQAGELLERHPFPMAVSEPEDKRTRV